MMKLLIQGIPTSEVSRLQNKGVDSYGNQPQVHTAAGVANPCRHCLQLIEEGEDKLVLAYMPFQSRQPYAETGPIFLHNKKCSRYSKSSLPEWFVFLDPAIVRGYDGNDWIIYETGSVVAGVDIEKECINIFQNSDVKYIHVRSKYNCFQCKVERA
jgi:Protein of unknown function (DUF1203)